MFEHKHKKDYVRRRIFELSEKEEWNHQYYLAGHVKTRYTDVDSPGYNINKWKRLEPILEELSLEGKTILDIGCSDGYYSIQCAKKNVKHAQGLDPDPLRIKRANFMKELLEIDNVDFKVADFYDLTEDKKYDIILGLGLIHRIPDILKCLEKMSRLSDILVLEFKTYDSPEDTCTTTEQKKKHNEYNKIYSIPTQTYVKNRMEEFGFKYNSFFDDDSHLKYKRTILVSSRKK